jgi:hypothetical protein
LIKLLSLISIDILASVNVNNVAAGNRETSVVAMVAVKANNVKSHL